jgi:DNA topoisomerase-1
VLGEHPDKGGPVVVKNGRYGPYVSNNGVNATIMGDKTPETITLTEAVVLLDARAEALGQQPRRAAGRKKPGEASEAPKGRKKKAAAEGAEKKPAKKAAPRKKAAKKKADKVDAAE